MKNKKYTGIWMILIGLLIGGFVGSWISTDKIELTSSERVDCLIIGDKLELSMDDSGVIDHKCKKPGEDLDLSTQGRVKCIKDGGKLTISMDDSGNIIGHCETISPETGEIIRCTDTDYLTGNC